MNKIINYFIANDYITGDEFKVCEIANGWWKTFPDVIEYDRYYPSIYYSDGNQRFPKHVEKLQNLLYNIRAKKLIKLNNGKGSVLDIGCGPGHLLSVFNNLGCTCKGIEFNEYSAKIPREKYGLDVIAGDITEDRLDETKYDIVISWHTLEHMRDPQLALKRMFNVLKPGGLLLLSVPNFGSTEAIRARSSWFHLDVPRHINHFSSSFIKNLIYTNDAEIIEESYINIEYDLFCTVQTWQNKFGITHNLLYKSLRKYKSSLRVTIFTKYFTYVLALLLAPFAFLVSLYRSLVKDGSVITVIARKSKI